MSGRVGPSVFMAACLLKRTESQGPNDRCRDRCHLERLVFALKVELTRLVTVVVDSELLSSVILGGLAKSCAAGHFRCVLAAAAFSQLAPGTVIQVQKIMPWLFLSSVKLC